MSLSVLSVPKCMNDITPVDVGKALEDYESVLLQQKMLIQAEKNLKTNPGLKKYVSISDYVKAVGPVALSLTKESISEERIKKRLEICASCPLLTIIKDQTSCGVCGCVLKPSNKSIINLVSREETDYYGCKHPDGSRWRKAGV